ncbi:MAG: fibrobacter succinogenes major paralogous domain-containing protein [Paludibacter sp.]
MKKLQLSGLVALIMFIMFLTACEKKETIITVPVLSTTEVSNLTLTTCKSGGIITSDGGAAISARGVCWSTSPTPTIADRKTTDGTGTGTFISTIDKINADSTYYIRAYATNAAGTAYGNVVASLLTDLDGNIYHKVTIGTQTWMVENLKTTRYRTGEGITNNKSNLSWSTANYGAWCDYNNDSINGKKYGKLYNWSAISDSRNIAPVGWHVATNADWATLVAKLGGEGVAAEKLKEIGITHWSGTNINVTNESGFTALPGGYRSPGGSFAEIGDFGYWWTSTEYSSTDVRYWFMTYNNLYVHNDYNTKLYGRSVRCVKD